MSLGSAGIKLNYIFLFVSLQYPSIFTPLIDNLICNAGLSMIEAMLEPHLTLTAGATHSEIGTTFMIAGIIYSITTPITGYVCRN